MPLGFTKFVNLYFTICNIKLWIAAPLLQSAEQDESCLPPDICVTLAIFFMTVSSFDSVLSISLPRSSNILQILQTVQQYCSYRLSVQHRRTEETAPRLTNSEKNALTTVVRPIRHLSCDSCLSAHEHCLLFVQGRRLDRALSAKNTSLEAETTSRGQAINQIGSGLLAAVWCYHGRTLASQTRSPGLRRFPAASSTCIAFWTCPHRTYSVLGPSSLMSNMKADKNLKADCKNVQFLLPIMPKKAKQACGP